ncbi:MAG: hypothetical protein KatS3mg111_1649 [Pirellulaceae bacterium]|nr:MAG: hypothetical protein KatS3mg111_1649 [Pirellulaceae bacterium]
MRSLIQRLAPSPDCRSLRFAIHVVPYRRGTMPLSLFMMIAICFCGPIMLVVPAMAQQDRLLPGQVQCETINRRVPPAGQAPPPSQLQQWEERLAAMWPRIASLPSPHREDIEVLVKACRWAIDFHEFYSPKDFSKVDRLLDLADARLAAVTTDATPSPTFAPPSSSSPPSSVSPAVALQGRTVRGFRSRIDGSVQPVGLVFGNEVAETSRQRKVPLYVWLHGRGDKVTDLHFICQRLDNDGQIAPADAIVVHPFGRQCLGYKSAGETDVMEAIEFACTQYPVDRSRIVLMGFSMGGAGVWHLAAHYADRFVAASPGAGFAETARYQRLTPDQYPPPWVQILWNVYDVPPYTKNLFNLHLIAYSGELDKQIQAARVMEEAFQRYGRTLHHVIGPGMGHKYHPDSLRSILKEMNQWVQSGQPAERDRLFLQTRHLRYNKMRWLEIDGLQSLYEDTQVEAMRAPEGLWRLTTKNASRLAIDTRAANAPSGTVAIDGQRLELAPQKINRLQRTEAGAWQLVEAFPTLRKHHGLSGPMDDAFLEPFLFVIPTGQSHHRRIDQWVQCELNYWRNRWRYLFRGQVREKQDVDVTDEDMQRYHLVLWGTPGSNALLRRLLEHRGDGAVPIHWHQDQVRIGLWSAPADRSVPLAIYPNPAAPHRYVVINSGPTFRDAHDRTNSLQNPQLPDWAILSVDQPRSDESPGRVLRCGFFDDQWQITPALSWSSE